VHRKTPRALALAAHAAIKVEAAVLASPPAGVDTARSAR
jgi:hypothetical protein